MDALELSPLKNATVVASLTDPEVTLSTVTVTGLPDTSMLAVRVATHRKSKTGVRQALNAVSKRQHKVPQHGKNLAATLKLQICSGSCRLSIMEVARVTAAEFVAIPDFGHLE